MSTDTFSRPRREWNLTPAAFQRLLAALGPDSEQAAVAYEEMRRRLIGLLRWWGTARAEEAADQTLDRVARKLEEGAEIAAGSLGAYVRGVARMVFYESGRAERAEFNVGMPLAGSADAQAESSLSCLDRCLALLAGKDRTLVLRYYGEGKKAEVRRLLAEELGISSTALRIRTHRLREQLELCVTSCLEKI